MQFSRRRVPVPTPISTTISSAQAALPSDPPPPAKGRVSSRDHRGRASSPICLSVYL
ncbi:hypothetical protein LX36DRAFT_650237 [Colletotrichum falcatum]|nr:hypothetical protein LX36DRAFT_650237 [Colletotrichum falcatum]